MAITKHILNQDAYFRRVTGDKIIINDLSFYSITDIEHINKSLMTVYDSETFSTVPTCECGATKGVYNKGNLCLNCSTTCVDPKDNVQPLLWFKALRSDIPFVNPFFWTQFRLLINSKFDYLRWMCDPRYNPPSKPPAYLAGIRDILGGVRDYSVFINKIEEILLYFINHSAFKDPAKNIALQELLIDYREGKSDVFSTYLPIVNKKVFVMENTPMGKYTNLAVSDIIDSIMLWTKTVSDAEKLSPARLNVTTANIVSKLSGMYEEYYTKYLFKKQGSLRKHTIAARAHFSFRAVITSTPGKHAYDEIKLPYGLSIGLFRPHLFNKLVNQEGYSHKVANDLLMAKVKEFDPLIYKLLCELIQEAPLDRHGKPGIPCIIARNPTLMQGSMIAVRITEVLRDPDTYNMEMSALAVKSMNADFDGDALNGFLLGDEHMRNLFSVLESHYSIPDLSKPFSVSGNLNLLSPSNNILTQFMDDTNLDVSSDTVYDLL